MTKDNIYFIGIGGIGMSALARFFMHEGRRVAGYDLTQTPLTEKLATEGADIHYEEDVDAVPSDFRDPATTLVVYTPAIPAAHRELAWFREMGFEIEKRSEMLGHLADGHFVMAVAGTHGKTTTTTLVAWLNHVAAGGGSAFLGGISRNFDSNLVLGRPQGRHADDPYDARSEKRLAVEADEFDRSFLRLSPDVAAITSVDADHLDIYGTFDAVREAFSQFAGRIRPGGAAIINSSVDIGITNKEIAIYRYALDDASADFYAENLCALPSGHYHFDIVTPDGRIENCTLGITGRINVENAVAAVAMMWAAAKIQTGKKGGEQLFDHDKIRTGLKGFEGVKRRFEIWVNTPSAVYMDDYAHHPRELSAAIASLRAMFPGRKITAIFQPHLYSRTADFYREFAAALSEADELILTPIYPARELPVAGIDSELIGRHATIPWRIVAKEKLADLVSVLETDVVVTFGAGNIENHCAEIAGVVAGNKR